MGHPDFEQLRAFAARETSSSADRDRVAGHLGACPSCRGEVVVMRAVVAAAADASYTPPVPAGTWDRIVARRASGERTILPVRDEDDLGPATRSGATARRRVAIASALLLVLAGTAAAVTTPAVREWIARRSWPNARELPLKPATAPTRSAAASDGAGTSAAYAGVTIPVSGRDLWVAVDGADPGLRIRVRVTDDRDLEVRATAAAMSAVFKPRADGVGVSDAGPGELAIDLPRSARRFVLRVDGRPAIAKEGAELRVLTSSVDTVGTDLVVTPRRERVAPRPAATRRR